MSAPTFDDFFTIGKAEALVRRPDLFLSPGDITDFLLAAAAAMADRNVQFSAEESRKTFVDGATGADLTTLADDHFGVQRNLATAAVVALDFTRPSAGGGEPGGTISAGAVVSTVEDATGARVEYTVDTAVTWAAAEVATKSTTGTATSTGRDGDVAVAKVTNIVDAIFDLTITLTNPTIGAGGNEEETDEQLRDRVRAFPSTLRRGTLAALEFGALVVTAVRISTAVEDTTTGLVTVFVTDSSGNSQAQMVNDVIAELENWRCAGSSVSVVGGSVLTQAIDYSITVTAGTDATALETSIDAAITARMEKLDISDGTSLNPGILRRDAIASAIICVDIDNILGAVINTPSADVTPTIGQVLRAGTVTRT